MRAIPSLLIILLLMPVVGQTADVFPLDYVSLSDPEIPTISTIVVYDDRCLDLWRQALNRPETDLQCRSAATIAQAFQEGMPDVNTLIPDLRKRLNTDGTAPSSRYAAARALIIMKDRESIATLFQQSQQGNQSLRQFIEPVLAEWNYEPIRAVWIKRLNDPEVRHQDLLLAMRGLGQVAATQAAPRLLELVHSAEQPFDVRLTAADAAGLITPTGLENDVRRLLEHPETPRRLLAMALLSRHDTAATAEILAALVKEPEPTVASKALARLRAIAPEQALTLAELAMRHADANVRREGIELYLGWPTPDRIDFVGRLLDDPHPALRGRIRDAFVTLAKQTELETAIINVSRTVLAEPHWRGQEQATIVLASLNHQSSADRFLELLQSPREEVHVTAAWGLRKLAVPETAAAIAAQIRSQTDRRRKQESIVSLDAQVAHLCEALGVLEYAPADALLQEYIPLDLKMGQLSRPSAIWAVGKLRENQPNEALAKKLVARVLDTASIPAEISEVRQMSAVSLARIGAKSAVETLRGKIGPQLNLDRESLVYRWAVMQLTDENIALPASPRVNKGGWFLESAKSRNENGLSR